MILAIDTETTGTDWWHGCRPFFVSACDNSANLYWWEWSVDPLTRKPCISRRDALEIQHLISVADTIVMHNAKFDIRMLSGLISNKVIDSIWDKLEDTLIMSHCLRNHWDHSLKHLAEVLLGIPSDDETLLQKTTNRARALARKHFPNWCIARRGGPNFPGIRSLPGVGWWVMDTWLPRAIAKTRKVLHDEPLGPYFESCLRTYAKRDAERTTLVYKALRNAFTDDQWGIYTDRKRLLKITYDMETRGVMIDADRVSTEIQTHEALIEKADNTCLQIADINLASNLQLRRLLFGTWGLPASNLTPKGSPSTNEASLKFLKDYCDIEKSDTTSTAKRFLSAMLDSRKHTKSRDYLSSYAAWSKDSVIHSSLNITGTSFTRQSSSNPNLQNVGTGKDSEEHNLRSIFVPRPNHCFVCIDYSNLELRIWAYSCGNPELIEAFETGESVHYVIACELHPNLSDLDPEQAKETPEYKRTKNGNFAIIYGAGEKRANDTYQVKDGYARIAKRFPQVRSFTQRLHRQFLDKGHITTLGGYQLVVPSDEPHKVVSAFVQGTAGDIIGEAMRRCAGPNELLLQIHDELVFEVPTTQAEMACKHYAQQMQSVGDDIGIPTPVGAVIRYKSWGGD